jgi:two-component system nitrate/nitrite response regulator NarL
VEAPSVLLWTAVRIYRDGLAALLRRDERIGPVSVTAEPADCLAASLRTEPDVVVIDACSPLAVEVAADLRGCAAGVVALGIPESEADVVALAEVGVAAYLTQEQTLEDLVDAIMAVARGEADCGPRVMALLLRHVAATADAGRGATRTVRLTRRELEILRLIGDGLTNKQIGRELSIELPTVKNHVHHVLEKIGASTRAEAVAMTRGTRPAVAVDLVGSR